MKKKKPVKERRSFNFTLSGSIITVGKRKIGISASTARILGLSGGEKFTLSLDRKLGYWAHAILVSTEDEHFLTYYNNKGAPIIICNDGIKSLFSHVPENLYLYTIS